jgi:hypothetical protein
MKVKSIVYYVQRKDGAVKVGTSRSAGQRFEQIEKQHGELRFLAYEDGDRKRETFMHDLFADTRLDGEWFEPSTELVSYIKMIRKACLAGLPNVELDDFYGETYIKDLPKIEPPEPVELAAAFDSSVPTAVRMGMLTDFVALPSDPNVPLTDEQMYKLFNPDQIPLFMRELAKHN